jgi:hypothetical protein
MVGLVIGALVILDHVKLIRAILPRSGGLLTALGPGRTSPIGCGALESALRPMFAGRPASDITSHLSKPSGQDKQHRCDLN